MLNTHTVSAHEIRIFSLFEAHPSRWLTSAEVATEARVSPRTARAHTLKLVQAGVLDIAAVFPGHRYRLRSLKGKKAPAYYQRLKSAQDVFGAK